MNCADCNQPVKGFSFGYGKPAAPNGYTVCPKCRGKRSAKVNREKAAKHGRSYFSKTGREGSDARG